MCLFQMGILPIMISFNFMYPIYSVFLNAIILPFFSILLFSSVLSIGIIDWQYQLAKIFANVASFIIDIYDKMCNFIMILPSSRVILGKQSTVNIIIYYFIYFFIIYYFKSKESKIDYCKDDSKKSWFYYISFYLIRIKHFIISTKK